MLGRAARQLPTRTSQNGAGTAMPCASVVTAPAHWASEVQCGMQPAVSVMYALLRSQPRVHTRPARQASDEPAAACGSQRWAQKA
jgi:hypothetical protein